MSIDCTQWIIKQVDVSVLINSTCQAHTLLLTSAQIDALSHDTHTQWIIKQVDVGVLINSTCQAHTLLLTSAQIDALSHNTHSVDHQADRCRRRRPDKQHVPGSHAASDLCSD